MSKAKLMNDASVQRVTTVPAADLVNVVDNATGKVKAIEYNALLTQLRNDLLGGRVVGNDSGDLVEFYNFPSRATLVSEGYLNADETDNDGALYFNALLRYLLNVNPEGGCYIGRLEPSSKGIAIMNIYKFSGTVTKDTLPNYASGMWLDPYIRGVSFFSAESRVFKYAHGKILLEA